ncbi:oxidoreductase [Achromobacter sp. SD115]|uniref:PDR/VanB family oxidoreductase n=1 Tax=Achromobacter sp. SD115 TaxID=2782011 RepID=UPI001A9773A4|nr:PDR/VanB family oxidoreductase [Achromobacter sp. SD115]MBO1017176.1 oxidoreductase [Achromobacter sp. SD115]
MQVKVLSIRRTADDIVAVELVPSEGLALPAFDAGAHIDVQLPGGLTRQYSICSSPQDRSRYVLGVLKARESRGGSLAIHALQEGDIIQIGAPRNQFALARHARHSILIAGGIGITPILSMAETLSAENASFALHYCVRDQGQVAFRERLACAALESRVFIHADNGPTGSRLDLDHLLNPAASDVHVYVCGPGGFIEMVLASARRSGWQEDRLHREFFAPAEAPTDDSPPFELLLARSGLCIPVASGQTALAALRSAGIEIPTACEQGICGTCLTRVIEGVPDHRDACLSDEEKAGNDQFLPCCSRARTGHLVIDL